MFVDEWMFALMPWIFIVIMSVKRVEAWKLISLIIQPIVAAII